MHLHVLIIGYGCVFDNIPTFHVAHAELPGNLQRARRTRDILSHDTDHERKS